MTIGLFKLIEVARYKNVAWWFGGIKLKFLTPEEVVAKKELKKKLIIAGSIVSVGVISGFLTVLLNTAM